MAVAPLQDGTGPSLGGGPGRMIRPPATPTQPITPRIPVPVIPRQGPVSAPPPVNPAPLSAADTSFVQWLTSVYQTFLGRAPEQAAINDALNAWHFFNAKGGGGGVPAGPGELAGGEDQADIAYKIATSQEAVNANKYAGGLNPTSALALVNQDYQNLLNRAPGQEVIEDALVALLGGYETPAQFISKIQASPEYLALHPPAPTPAPGPTPQPTPTPTPTPTPAPAPTPTPPGPGPVEPGLVRFEGLNEFDPNYAQNLAVFGGGMLQRPVNELSFNPFSQNPFQGSGQPSGGGNSPVLGLPPTLLQNALANSSATGGPGATNHPSPTSPTSPTPTGPTGGGGTNPVTIGQPTAGIPTGSAPSPANPTLPPAQAVNVATPIPAASPSGGTTPAPTTTGQSASSLMNMVNRNIFPSPGNIKMPLP